MTAVPDPPGRLVVRVWDHPDATPCVWRLGGAPPRGGPPPPAAARAGPGPGRGPVRRGPRRGRGGGGLRGGGGGPGRGGGGGGSGCPPSTAAPTRARTAAGNGWRRSCSPD